MNDQLDSALATHFGHSHFRPLQREIVDSVLQGNPALAILPTGGGKSLTYQLPALLLDGLSIVISPLLSLIEDQTQELQKKGIPVERYDSTQSYDQKQNALKRIESGSVKLFYTSPESLVSPELLKRLKSQNIALVAIDEAHCISEWGHSFRPSYLFLPKIIRSLKPHSILALTATATKKTASDIRKLFRIKTAEQFQSSHFRENLHFKITPVSAETRNNALLESLQTKGRLPAIVYAMRQEDCERIASLLSDHGFNTRSYHAGLTNKSRVSIQDAFLQDKIDIVVATIAFGMGVDKPNIRSVIHYHLPKSPEGWMQESGRAGRDGASSLCQLLACGDDLVPLENFIYAKEIKPATLQRFLSSLSSQGNSVQISPYQTRIQYDFLVSTLDVLLAKLEVRGHLKFTGSEWRYIRAWPVAGKQVDLTTYPLKIQHALESIFSLGNRYDTFETESEFGIKPNKLWTILHELRDTGDIVYKPSGWLWNYKLLKPINEDLTKVLILDLSSQFKNGLHKVHAVEQIATSRQCIPSHLAKWFGEKLPQSCGHCSSCIKEKRPRKLPISNESILSDEQLERIKALLSQSNKRFQNEQQLTRFLCGIPSPYIRHYFLHQKKEFGMLSYLPYADVNAYAKAMVTGV
ncbi:RecQ family ATP-dependent DNA helicase [Rubritalea spongiae]|uniref:ATP-dependent DNA helicase RecQ n=1 Tax=Rubritalea spongiae TaxID=430797 RepID=A0ABW5E6Q7_9BACT